MINQIARQSDQLLRKTYRGLIFIKPKYFQDFVFIHINKTGGTSIEKALGLPLIHKTALEYKAEIGERRWQQRFSFAVVRNPWDKVASQFHYRKMINETQLRKKPVEFNDWVKMVFVDKHQQYYNEEKMFAAQMDWVTDKQGKVIIDYIAKFEQLQDDWKIITEKLQRQQLLLPHVKKSSRTDYRHYYKPESIDIISKWFAKDIDYFNYSFER